MRGFVAFGDLWTMPIAVPYSMLVRDGDLAWSCGQLALDAESRVLAPGDLATQSKIVCDSIEELLCRSGLAGDSVGKLLLYHAAPEAAARDAMLDVFRDRFGEHPILLPVAVPHFYYEGVLLEVDVFASARLGENVTDRNRHAALRLVDAGDVLWCALEFEGGDPASAVALLEGALRNFGLRPEDRLCERWTRPGDGAALQQAGLLLDGGMAIKVTADGGRVAGDFTFVRGAAATGAPYNSGNVRVTQRRAGPFTWIGARCLDAGLGLVAQTESIMRTIRESLTSAGLDFADVVKSSSHYVGGSTAAELHDNMAVRNRCYSPPGPASTGLPVAGFMDPASLIAVDLLALRRT